MTETSILALILFFSSLLVVSGKLELDMIGFITLSALMITGILPLDHAFLGFSSSPVITVALIFALGGAVKRSGLGELAGSLFHKVSRGNLFFSILMVLITSTTFSSVLNNIAVVAIFLPSVIRLSDLSGVSRSFLLLPLSFGAVLGGMLTPYGTPPNLVASAILKSATGADLKINDFFINGGILTLCGVIITIIGAFLFLSRREKEPHTSPTQSISDAYQIEKAIRALEIPYGSSLSGKTLSEIKFSDIFGVRVVALQKGNKIESLLNGSEKLFSGDKIFVIPSRIFEEKAKLLKSLSLILREDLGITHEDPSQFPELKIIATHEDSAILPLEFIEKSVDTSKIVFEVRGPGALSDAREKIPELFADSLQMFRGSSQSVLFVVGDKDLFQFFASYGELQFIEQDAQFALEQGDSTLIEVMLSPRSRFIGKTLAELSFRERFDFTAISVLRQGKVIQDNLRNLKLEFGDTLLLLGLRSKLHALTQNSDFVPFKEEGFIVSPWKIFLTMCALVLLIVLTVHFSVPSHIAAFATVGALILTRVITPSDMYRDIDWRVVMMLGCFIPLGEVIKDSSMLQILTSFFVYLSEHADTFWVIVALLVVTSVISQLLEATVSVILIVPAAIALSVAWKVDPAPIVLAVALASSIAFLAPFSHRSHLLVVTSGGYKPRDFFRVGLPVTIVLLVLLSLLTYMMVKGQL